MNTGLPQVQTKSRMLAFYVHVFIHHHCVLKTLKHIILLTNIIPCSVKVISSTLQVVNV